MNGRVRLRENDATRVPPGSAIKPFVAMCLLQERAAGAVRCSGLFRIGERSFRCSHPRAFGALDLRTALAWSCNEYFGRAAGRVRPAILADALRSFGLDARMASTPEEQALLALGSSGVAVTALELARAYKRLAAGRVPPPVFDGLREAATTGTARLARPGGMTVCGKTGTGPFALFAGWAPASAPRVVVAAITPGGRGGTEAAPVARRLFEKFA